MTSVAETVEEYCTQLRRRQIEGSMPCAKRTAEIMRLLVTNQKHADASSVIDDVRSVGHKLQAAKPVELAIGNIVRRVLHMIREEEQHDELSSSAMSFAVTKQDTQKQSGPSLLSQALRLPSSSARIFPFNRAVSLSNLLDVGIEELEELVEKVGGEAAVAEAFEAESHASTKKKQKSVPQWKNKQHIIEAINELIDELDNIQQSITVQGVEHIHANEVILTFGMSDTTYLFLKEASKKREFQVVVAEGAPKYDGHIMARKLSDAGIQTTLIADCAVFAMMARVNKVLVGAHAVLANGGVVGTVGMHMVALAAKKHSIPFVVLVGLHKLSPLFPHDPDLAFNDFKSPADVVDFDVVAEAFAQQGQHEEASGALGTAPSSNLATVSSLASASSIGASAASTTSASGAAGGVCKEGFMSAGGAASQATALGHPCGSVHVPNPMYDYVPPNLISLFVTDMGGYTPSYVYRLLAEFFDRNDYLLSKQLNMSS
eukprot:CAMPEP_0202895266 /NCGR_PEP_ID=MMETSP1392-20130828/4501_1 /ASSEMBLY_ACC=CAM_ASM_000868 /TAXON_ID=225041 /ORGANISM="Chlamydomonas chlamydogama, Strain SAG 11-48b" /LENGTH=487 /DNA_ID=CAMNT_0049580215 /DNA_START=51 /DNA_END=1514 /DNA_ORIENTATION=-